MNEFRAWHADTLGAKAVDALAGNGFTASYFPTRQEAVEKILSLIPREATVGIGGSWTINGELGLGDLLEDRGNIVYNHNKPGLSQEQSLDLRRKELTSDVFLTGTKDRKSVV